MTVQLIEGYDHFSDATLLTEKSWTTVTNSSGISYSLVSGRISGNAVAIVSSFVVPNLATSDNYFIKSISSTMTQFVGAFAFYVNELPAPGNSNEIAFWMTGGGTKAVRVFLNANGTISVQSSGGTVIATGTAVLTINAWHYLEFKCVINGASGSVQSQIDGVADIGSTAGNFGSTGITSFCPDFVPQNGNLLAGTRTQRWDDVYLLNTASSPNNNFLGDVHVETIYPASDGAHSQWTPNSGVSHFNRVNEHTTAPYPDGDTTYVTDATVGDIDTYIYDVLAALSGTVFAVQTNLVARKDDALTRQIAPVLRESGTDRVGNNFTLATSYVDGTQIYETDPATSAAWSVSGVNATQFGAKVTT